MNQLRAILSSLLIWHFSATCALPQNPSFAQVEDKPGLPRVLLLGDSISIGYTIAVREQLDGIANVHRPAENCSSTRVGLERLGRWLGDAAWDVIHFNFGLHDQKYVMGKGTALVELGTKDSHLQVPLAEYEANLEKIVGKLKSTNAKLIWCTTTPVPEGAVGRVPDDTRRYNEAALRVMQHHGVAVNDLYAYALPKLPEIQRPKDVHYTPEGSAVLASQVVSEIKKLLADR